MHNIEPNPEQMFRDKMQKRIEEVYIKKNLEILKIWENSPEFDIKKELLSYVAKKTDSFFGSTDQKEKISKEIFDYFETHTDTKERLVFFSKVLARELVDIYHTEDAINNIFLNDHTARGMFPLDSRKIITYNIEGANEVALHAPVRVFANLREILSGIKESVEIIKTDPRFKECKKITVHSPLIQGGFREFLEKLNFIPVPGYPEHNMKMELMIVS